jgi:hypothetical protein
MGAAESKISAFTAKLGVSAYSAVFASHPLESRGAQKWQVVDKEKPSPLYRGDGQTSNAAVDANTDTKLVWCSITRRRNTKSKECGVRGKAIRILRTVLTDAGDDRRDAWTSHMVENT